MDTAQVKPRRSTLRIVLYTLGIVAAIGLVLIGIFAYLAIHSYKGFEANDKAAVTSIVDQFVGFINQDKDQQAYDLFDDSVKKQLTFDDFNKSVTDLKPIFNGFESESSDFISTKLQYVSDGVRLTYSTKVSFSDGSVGTLNVVALKRSNMGWTLYNVYMSASPQHLKSK